MITISKLISTFKEAGIFSTVLFSGGMLYILILLSIFFYQLVLYLIQTVTKKTGT
jgi:hypothetical protein